MASYQPPFQPGNHSNNFNNCNEGRSLLDLLRARDKKLSKQSPQQHHDDADAADDDMLIINDDDNDDQEDDDEITELEEELIQRLQSLNYSIRRRGIFNNDANRANLYYSHASDRGGSLAGGDAAAADNGGSGGSGGGGSKKRKRNKGSGGGSTASSGGGGLSAAAFGIFLESSHNNSNATNATNGNAPYVGISASSGEKNLDEGLLVTVICRILGVTMGRRKKREGGSDAAVLTTKGRPSSFPLICAALNVLSSFCDHAKDGMVSSLFGDSQCASIEAEMMACIGTNVLDALCDNSLLYFQTILAKEDNDGKSSREELQNGLIASLRACASVVSLLETRLSRADKTMNNLRGAAWLILGNLVHLTNNSNSYGRTTNGESCTVQKAATMLLATLPLAGNSESVPPSKLWSQSIRDGMTLLRWAINDFFPMPSADGRTTTVKDESKSNLKLWNDHQHWASIAKEAPSSEELDLGNDPTDNHRANALLSRIQCLTNYLHSLLTMEGYSLHRANSNLSSTIIPLPFDSILDTSELLLSFPLAAEVKHRSSKPRLRSSPVAGGQISPNAAMSISATMRVCGHTLLDVAIESCRGGSGALGRSHRIVGMAVANLQSSCSLALVSVVDGQRNSGISSSSSSSRAGEGNNSKGARMGWLRGSIPLRIKSIQTFHAVAVSLGSGVMSSAGTAKAVSRGLVLLGGCLLEQVQGEGAEKDGQTLSGSGGGTDEEWGTLGERAKLV